jgi:hypothetical protein
VVVFSFSSNSNLKEEEEVDLEAAGSPGSFDQ